MGKGLQRWALAVALALIALPLALAIARGHRDAIFPQAGERFDVTDLWLAPAAEVCPGLAADNRSVRIIEDCTGMLSLAEGERVAAFQKLTIPDLANMPINTYPSFPDLVKEQGLASAHQAIVAKELVAMGFRLPKRLFDENRFHTSPNVLVLAGITDARICYAGRCPHFTNHDSYLGLQFPLFAPRDVTLPETVDVWIVFLDHRNPWGLNLEHALFVARGTVMKGVSLVHKPLILGSWVFQAALLLGIALMALVYATLWSDYVDYAAFAAMVCVYFLNAIYEMVPMSVSTDVLPITTMRTIRLSLMVQVPIAAAFFAFATLRPRPTRFWPAWLACAVVASGTVWTIWALDPTQMSYAKVKLPIAWIQMLLPVAIAVGGGVLIARGMRRGAGGDAEVLRDAARRMREQWIAAAGLVVAAAPNLWAALLAGQGLHTYDVTTLNGVALFPVFAAMLYGANGALRKRADAYRKELVQKTRQAALGEMVQMLAHDVRKPFSLLRMGLELMGRARSFGEMRDTMGKLAPQVAKSMRSVSGMLEDVMAVSSEPTLTLERVTVAALVAQCVQDVFVARPEADVALTYDLRDDGHELQVDSLKVLRVMTNILENAVQATGGRCRVWFNASTRHAQGRAWLELVVGNSGSVIATERQERIFDAFFTEGKRGGTGLGLAVARRFVELHGGRIACRSSAEIGTEFVLTLPAVTAPSTARGAGPTLPAHSHVFAGALQAAETQVVQAMREPTSARERQAVERASAAARQLGRPLRVLLVDDEPIYSAALAALVDVDADAHHGTWLKFETAVDGVEARDITRLVPADLTICDVDLGTSDTDGLELAEKLKSKGCTRMTCIHSNRSLPADYKRAIAAGADLVLPKPMSRAHLLELLATAAETALAAEAGAARATESAPAERALVVVVDDDVFVREAWSATLAPDICVGLASHAEAAAWMRANPADLARAACIVLDLHIEERGDGLELARVLREELGCTAPIVLSTDAYGDVHGAEDLVNAVIAKEALTLDALLLATKGRRGEWSA